jgi:hypothetical protein
MRNDIHRRPRRIRPTPLERAKADLAAPAVGAPARPRRPAVPPTVWEEDVVLKPARSFAPAAQLLRRVSLAGVLVLLVAVLGLRAQAQSEQLRGEVTARTETAKTALTGAKASLAAGDFAAAQSQFTIAKTALHSAATALGERGQVATPGGAAGTGSVAAGTRVLATGELLAGSGADLSGDLSGISTDLTTSGGDLLHVGTAVTTRLPAIQRHLDELRLRMDLLAGELKTAPRDGPLAGAADTLMADLPKLQAATGKAREVAGALPNVLGTDRFKQYLLWFQNPAELRPTGGFIGTYGRLKFDNGGVSELLVDSIYNPANQANVAVKDPAPRPYGRFYGDNPNPIWAMQDANWSPDLSESARKFQYFYEKSGGPTTDGLIALTTTPIVEILRVVGPIPMPESGYTLTADNFQQIIQADQKAKSQIGEPDPKKILRDFTPKLLAKIGQAPPEGRQAVVTILGKAVASRDLTLFFNDDRAEHLAESLGAAGRLEPGPTALALVDTNIAGGKSSADIATSLNDELTIADDGRTTGSLTLTRRHTAATVPETNLNFTRLFFPDGSQVSGFAGFAEYAQPVVDRQDGRVVLGGWTDVIAGSARAVQVSYTLPNKVDLGAGRFPLVFTKQAGTAPQLKFSLTLPPGYRWNEGQGSVVDQTLTIEQTATADVVRTLTFQKR